MITTINEFKDSLSKTIIAYHGGTLKGELRPPIFLAADSNEAKHYIVHADEPEITSLFEIQATTSKIFNLRSEKDAKSFIDIIRKSGFEIEIQETKYGWEIPEKYTEPIRKNSQYDGYNMNDWSYVPEVRKYLLQMGYDTIHATDDMGFTEVPIYILLNPQQQVKSIKKIE